MPGWPLTAWMRRSAKLWGVSLTNTRGRFRDEPEAGISHAEGSGAGAVLGLDDLVAAELDALGEGVEFVRGDTDGGLGLAEEGDDGLAGVAADDGDDGVGGVLLAGELLDEGLGADDVEGGDAEEALGVEDAGALEHLGGDGHRAVYGVGDDEDERLGAVLGHTLDEVADDAGVDLEEVVACHARFA